MPWMFITKFFKYIIIVCLYSQGVVTLVNQLGATSVAIISSCSHALKTFEAIASQKSILMKYSLKLEKDDQHILESVVNFLGEKAVSNELAN